MEKAFTPLKVKWNFLDKEYAIVVPSAESVSLENAHTKNEDAGEERIFVLILFFVLLLYVLRSTDRSAHPTNFPTVECRLPRHITLQFFIVLRTNIDRECLLRHLIFVSVQSPLHSIVVRHTLICMACTVYTYDDINKCYNYVCQRLY